MEQKHRSEFPEKELWDLTALYQDREDFLRAIEKAREDINQFSRDYKGNLHTFEDFEKVFAELEQIYIQMSHIGNYGFMPQTTDYSNDEFANIAQAGMEFETDASVALTFFDDALVAADEEVLDRLGKLPHLTAAIRQAKIKKAHYLGADVEKALTNLGEVFYSPQDIYTKMRAGDFEMADFAPVAQRYLKHVAKVNGLEKMTFADWKLDLDSALNPEVTIDDAYDLVMKSVEPLGQEYCQEVARYQEERWVDFAANSGKDSGGYAADPYRVHPYVLMSWTGRLSDVYTLIHEIGHSGQFIFSDNHQSYFNAHMSTYYVEAPSTFNELLLSDYLENQSNDPRQKRFALAHRLTDTYFHNFITHLLEAAFQRKVYTLIEEGETFGASKLNSIMKEVLTDFWGDAIEIDDDAALTWMRQAHYYMGLYSYTYSAGLVISTAGYLHLKNSETGAEDWLNLLKSGGSKTPLESAMIIGADISTDKPLRDTIQFLSDTVDQIIAYSAELGE